ncbi:MAG: TolC family protein, partial [Tidjanibacter sp.]|nr:TolC family protein [Tidjanibacter sp.]
CAVVESYFAVCLAERIVEVRMDEVSSLAEHLRQARSLEREGMIVPAERLTAEVAWEQAKSQLTTAQSDLNTTHRALATLLGCDTLAIAATTPLFIPETMPSKEFLFSQIPLSPTLQSIEHQREIASLSLSAERGRYLPSVALLGHQQLWSVGLNKNLFPRTIVGVGLSWTLFDGLMREGAIARAGSLVRTTSTTHQKVGEDIRLAIEKLHSAMTSAVDEYRVGTHTIALARELLRSRERAFAEGMATSSEVVDARLMLSQIEVANLVNLYRADCALGTLLMLTGRMDNYLSYISD